MTITVIAKISLEDLVATLTLLTLIKLLAVIAKMAVIAPMAIMAVMVVMAMMAVWLYCCNGYNGFLDNLDLSERPGDMTLKVISTL